MPDMSLRYYTHNANSYVSATRHVDMTKLYARFLPHVRAGGLILDAGCGSGRDARTFLQRGYAVEAFDASPELAQLASQHTGIPVKVMRFQELDDTARFDAIWACASLLHVPTDEQAQAWSRLWQSLQPGGVIYASYKLGPDIEANGLALCALHHQVFDLGAFTILPDTYSMVFSQHAVSGEASRKMLLGFHGAGIILPQSKDYYPRTEFLHWHEKEVFKKPGREM